MGLINWYLTLLDWPLLWVLKVAQMQNSFWIAWGWRLIITFLLIVIIVRTIRGTVRKVQLMMRPDSILDPSDLGGTASGALPLSGAVGGGTNIEATVTLLKRTRDYAKIGELYASVNKFKEASKWYGKSGNKKESAFMLAKAGNPAKAAKSLLKLGAFLDAGRLYEQAGKHLDAAKAYAKGGKPGNAGAAYGKAGKYTEAIAVYSDYFAGPVDPVETQIQVAEGCYAMLESADGKAKVPDADRKKLLPALARLFEQAKKFDLAARLYVESGNLGRAGEVFLQLGRLEDAAKAMKQAGKDKEANQIAGRFYEGKQKWREAALSYAAAGEYLKAADCYARAADPVRSGECYEKGGDFYRAGLAYAHAASFPDCIRVLQKLKEDDKNFNMSRALLGRAFYELHDFEHCAATLDNHLTGARVESGNKEYFYMLALAYEQLGKLAESRELLYKLRSVDVQYKDITNRISNISSRISMKQSALGAGDTMATPTHGGGAQAQQNAQNVESSLEGRYKIERELGRGGMGVVYLAKDTQLDRQVALKFLGTLVDNSEEFRQRFIREAKAAAKINHPNIISIYDISATSGKAYIAMEFVDGFSLSRYLGMKQKLSAREAVNIIAQACSALAAIHDAGIVHRDIKPDNILIAKGGLVKLTDFGLAKSGDNRLTRTGTSMGTPSYMSPEQVLGKDADARSDIYSMGLVLHELLTGQTVFREGDVLERQLQEMPKPPSASAEGVPPELDHAILKAVMKKPDERWPDVKSFIEALRAVKVS
jgi:tetratricopeptide (TPR) repeat protein